MVWAHHMFTVGLGPTANAIFAVATMAIAVPTGVKIFNWLATVWGGSIELTTPMIYAMLFIPSFVMGGVTGVMQASAPADYQYHDSYFIVAHFHYVIVGGVVFALLAGLHFYWPIMFGTMLNEKLGKLSAWLFIIGFHLTFLIQHFLGLFGMPRRVYTYLPGNGYEIPNLVSTIGALVMAIAVIILLINIIMTLVKNERVGRDPWGDGRTLEWSLPIPVPFYNFAQTPLIRGLDAFWIEKKENNGQMMPAESLGDIHMPNNTILPFIQALGLFVAAFGALYFADGKEWALDAVANLPEKPWAVFVLIIGLAITAGAMIARSLIDDHGYYVKKEEVLDIERGLK